MVWGVTMVRSEENLGQSYPPVVPCYVIGNIYTFDANGFNNFNSDTFGFH